MRRTIAIGIAIIVLASIGVITGCSYSFDLNAEQREQITNLESTIYNIKYEVENGNSCSCSNWTCNANLLDMIEELLRELVSIRPYLDDAEIELRDKIDKLEVQLMQLRQYLLEGIVKTIVLGKYATDDNLSYLILLEDNKYVFNRHVATSFLPTGNFEIVDNKLILLVYSEENFVFKIVGQQLIFYSGELATSIIKPGTVFTLVGD